MKITIPACLLVIVFTIYSCQREPSFNDIDTPPEDPVITIPDSTLLVKSIRFIGYNDFGVVMDSITEFYSYDTVNKKITLTWESDSWTELNEVKADLFYNSKQFLTEVDFSYPPGYSFIGYEQDKMSISYDNANVLQSILIDYIAEVPVTINFVKTVLPQGYRLSWENPLSGNDWMKRVAIFDGQGRSTKTTSEFPVFDGGGNLVKAVEYIDSATFDASGQIYQVYFREIDTTDPPHPAVLNWEFQSRSNKGGQLATQRRMLVNGVHNLPFGDYEPWFSFSILCFHLDNFHTSQYNPVPFQSAKVINGATGGYDQVTAGLVFDTKDRLTEFTGFFRDYWVRKEKYKISYYK